MYCVKCGVELADSENKCPLCGTPVYHPELARPAADKPYPPDRRSVEEEVNRSGVLFIITVLFSLPLTITLLCDWRINSALTWSGYVAGAILLCYIIVVLPMWFKNPNPVIFVPVDFAAIAAYLLYIDFAVDGHWFLSFALPVTGGCALIVTAVVTLCRYVRRGYLYIFGGAMLLTGGFMMLVEFLLNSTFHVHEVFFWSFYPLAVFTILGAMLIVIAICRPLRESLHKKFFL